MDGKVTLLAKKQRRDETLICELEKRKDDVYLDTLRVAMTVP